MGTMGTMIYKFCSMRKERARKKNLIETKNIVATLFIYHSIVPIVPLMHAAMHRNVDLNHGM
jgi:hypothetical protein